MDFEPTRARLDSGLPAGGHSAAFHVAGPDPDWFARAVLVEGKRGGAELTSCSCFLPPIRDKEGRLYSVTGSESTLSWMSQADLAKLHLYPYTTARSAPTSDLRNKECSTAWTIASATGSYCFLSAPS